jgi:hypothetical protein
VFEHLRLHLADHLLVRRWGDIERLGWRFRRLGSRRLGAMPFGVIFDVPEARAC